MGIDVQNLDLPAPIEVVNDTEDVVVILYDRAVVDVLDVLWQRQYSCLLLGIGAPALCAGAGRMGSAVAGHREPRMIRHTETVKISVCLVCTMENVSDRCVVFLN
jgi:hypothetical protein